MNVKSYSKAIKVQATPNAIFRAITEQFDKWWTVHSNKATTIGDTLTVRFGENTIKEFLVTELKENKVLKWEVIRAFIDIPQLSKKDEWVGTSIEWRINALGKVNEIEFTHEGLVPEFECYEACEGGWNYFLESLRQFLNEGKGTPHKAEQ